MLNLKKLFRSNKNIDSELAFKHCQNEYYDYVLTDKEKMEERAYQLNFEGFTHSTRNSLLI